MRLNRLQSDESIDQRSALFIRDDLSSKYFQSVAQRIKMCKGSVGHFQASGSWNSRKNEEEAEKALQLLEIEPEGVEATLLKEKMSKIRLKRLLRIWRKKTQGWMGLFIKEQAVIQNLLESAVR